MNNMMCARKHLHINSSTLQLQINHEILLIIFVLPGFHMFRNIFVISGWGMFGLVCVWAGRIHKCAPLENMNGRTLFGEFSRLRVGALGGGFHGLLFEWAMRTREILEKALWTDMHVIELLHAHASSRDCSWPLFRGDQVSTSLFSVAKFLTGPLILFDLIYNRGADWSKI